ncbi:MAG: hypothetical protein CMH75_00685 [Nitrospina sp.]|nr:hypothetical protein [Nitrospina sp.]
MPKQINFLTIATALMAVSIIWGVHLLYKEWRSQFINIDWAVRPFDNQLSYQTQRFYEFAHHYFTRSSSKGLPAVRLYISQKARNKLMEDPPQSTKKWKKAFMLYPDGKLTKIKVRHRGDAARNWAYDKKSWRIKASKKKLFDRVRVYDYDVPKHETLLGNYIAYHLGNKAGVLSPKPRLVELFINEESYGVYIEVEHLDESFLRNNGVMPVNFYKGEQVYNERLVTIDFDLFNNPSLWRKISVFNRAPEGDYSDLAYFLNLVREAETSESSFAHLKQVARIDDWARFSAYQTLVHAWHNDWRHNMRLVMDPWKGSVTPTVHDSISLLTQVDELKLNKRSHALLTLYNKSSEFLLEKHKNLFKFVDEGLFKETIQHLGKLIPDLVNTMSRDKFRHQQSHLKIFFHPVNEAQVREEWNELFKKMLKLHEWLRAQFYAPPHAEWKQEGDAVALVIGGPVPVDAVTLSFAKGKPLPRFIGWDADGDGILSESDLKIPFRIEGTDLILDAIWLANQVSALERPLSWELIQTGDFTIVPTLFRLVGEGRLEPEVMKASSHLTGKQVTLSQGDLAGVTPSRWNRPVVDIPLQEIVWSGEKTIDEVRIISRPIKILPGTRILMKPGASLVFKNRVNIAGTVSAPVVVKSAVLGQNWGVLAFHGPKTTGSRVFNIQMEDGGEGKIDNIFYSAMLSIHESQGIHFKNLTMRKNTAVDDMMHVIYSKNIIIEDSVFIDAFADALDLDISNATVRNCQFLNSGNDAIDLMSSEVLITDSELSSSGDKGVSVGEDSRAMIYNTRINKNSIGVESKDASISCLINSLFENNKTQINASVKNWRYGTGGSAIADKSIFISSNNRFSADKNSNIRVIDSSINPMIANLSPQVLVDRASDDSSSDQAHLNGYDFACMNMLDKWKLKSKGSIRGIIQ